MQNTGPIYAILTHFFCLYEPWFIIMSEEKQKYCLKTKEKPQMSQNSQKTWLKYKLPRLCSATATSNVPTSFCLLIYLSLQNTEDGSSVCTACHTDFCFCLPFGFLHSSAHNFMSSQSQLIFCIFFLFKTLFPSTDSASIVRIDFVGNRHPISKKQIVQWKKNYVFPCMRHNSWKGHHRGQARTLTLLEIVAGLIPCGQLSNLSNLECFWK